MSDNMDEPFWADDHPLNRNAPKPEPPKRECFCRHFLRDGLHVHDCPDKPSAEPPPDVTKKHHWTTVDVNPDGPIICRYCEVLMTRENESEECKGQPPDVASEPVEAALSGAGVFKGASGLTGLRDAQAFWDQQPYGTRLYYDDYNYLHRGVLSAACDLIAENAALKAKLKAADHLIVTLTDNSAGFEAERDEARAEADELKASRAYEREEAERILNAEIERFSKLREERDHLIICGWSLEDRGRMCAVCSKIYTRRRGEKGGE